MSNEGSMKINVAKVRELAGEMSKIYNTYSNAFTQATTETEKLRNVWTGDAANAFSVSYKTLNGKCSEFMTTLNNTIRVLYEVADTYEASEKSIEASAEKLPSLPTNTMQ